MNAILIVISIASAAAALLLAAVAWRMGQDNRERSEARVAALADAIHGGSTGRAIFADDAPSVGRQPLIRFAVAGVMTLAVAAAVAFQLAPAAPPEGEATLELMSMRHTRDGAALTVMGVVRNPSGGAPTGRVSAVVVGFDRDGTLVNSSRAAIDLVTLAPGDESPFVVTLPRAAGIGRYRVTFRTEEGIIRHVDRRTDPVTLAVDGRQRS